MSSVHFYILSGNSSVDNVSCAIAAKAWHQGHSIHIHHASRQEAATLDDLLWSHKDISFLPHRMADTADPGATPIVLGWDGITPQCREVLINLGPEIPDFAAAFERVVEIVGVQESERARGRDRWREYRDRGFEVNKHDIGEDHAAAG